MIVRMLYLHLLLHWAERLRNMAYNHGLEEKKFKKEWERLNVQYRNAGMNDKQISEIYHFDREVFNSDRRYLENHDEFQLEVNDETENENTIAKQSKIIEKNIKAVSVEMEIKVEDTSFDWTDFIESDFLFRKVMKLSVEEKDLLRLFAIEELSVVEIAKMKKVAHQTISKKIKKLKEKMNQD